MTLTEWAATDAQWWIEMATLLNSYEDGKRQAREIAGKHKNTLLQFRKAS